MSVTGAASFSGPVSFSTVSASTGIFNNLNVTGVAVFTGPVSMGPLAANYLATQRADVGFEGVNIQGTPGTNSLVLLSGNTILGGDLSVTGTANFGSLNVDSLTIDALTLQTLSANTGVINSLTSTSITTSSVQTTTLSSSTIQATGVNVSSNVNVGGSLNVSGASVFTGPVSMSLLAANYLATQRADVGFEGVNIQGTPGDNSLVLLSGNTILGGDLSVTGTANFGSLNVDSLSIDNLALQTLSANTGVINSLSSTSITTSSLASSSVQTTTLSSSTIQATGVNVTSNVAVGGNLNVVGSAVFTGPVSMSLLAANYLATQRADVGFEGVNIQGTPGDNSLVLLSGNTILGEDLNVTGTANF